MPQYSLQQHDNGFWYIHWTEGRRSKRTSTGQKEEIAAQIFLGEWLRTDAADAGETPPTYTVGELWERYFTQHIEKNAMPGDTTAWSWKNLGPHFGPLTLPELTRKNEDGETPIDTYIDARETGKIGRRRAAPGTIRGELARLKACFNWCAAPKQNQDRTIIKPSDIPIFDLPPDSPPRDRWLRTEQVAALMAEAAKTRVGGLLQPVEVFLWLALQTAARMTAIFELKWDRVDFEIGKIDYRVPGRRVTKKKRAIVPISTTLKPILLEAKRQSDGPFVVPEFTPWDKIDALARRAGIDVRVSPHVLRHTAATLMLRRGVPIWTVAGILGDTVATVERVYGHHVPDGLAGGVEHIFNGSEHGVFS